jgi:hypothetical protein
VSSTLPLLDACESLNSTEFVLFKITSTPLASNQHTLNAVSSHESNKRTQNINGVKFNQHEFSPREIRNEKHKVFAIPPNIKRAKKYIASN